MKTKRKDEWSRTLVRKNCSCYLIVHSSSSEMGRERLYKKSNWSWAPFCPLCPTQKWIEKYAQREIKVVQEFYIFNKPKKNFLMKASSFESMSDKSYVFSMKYLSSLDASDFCSYMLCNCSLETFRKRYRSLTNMFSFIFFLYKSALSTSEFRINLCSKEEYFGVPQGCDGDSFGNYLQKSLDSLNSSIQIKWIDNLHRSYIGKYIHASKYLCKRCKPYLTNGKNLLQISEALRSSRY